MGRSIFTAFGGFCIGLAAIASLAQAAQPAPTKKPSKIRPVGYTTHEEAAPACTACGVTTPSYATGGCPNCDGCGDCGNCCNTCLSGPITKVLPCLFRKATRALDCLVPCGCNRPGKNLLDLSHFRTGCYECRAHGACLHSPKCGCSTPCNSGGCSSGACGIPVPPPAQLMPETDDPFKDDPNIPPVPALPPAELPAPPREAQFRSQGYWKTPYAAGQQPTRAPAQPTAVVKEKVERPALPPLKIARVPAQATSPVAVRTPVRVPAPAPIRSGPTRVLIQDEEPLVEAPQLKSMLVRQASMNIPAASNHHDAPPPPPASFYSAAAQHQQMEIPVAAPQQPARNFGGEIPVNPLRSGR